MFNNAKNADTAIVLKSMKNSLAGNPYLSLCEQKISCVRFMVSTKDLKLIVYLFDESKQK